MNRQRGFTLLELMVCVGLILMLAAMVIPSVIGLFSAGAEAQSYNIFASQLNAARALARTSGTYAAVHCGLGDPTVGKGENRNRYFVGIMQLMKDKRGLPEPDYGNLEKEGATAFYMAPGYKVMELPGKVVLGGLASPFVVGNQFDANALDDPNLDGNFANPADPAFYGNPTYRFLDFSVAFAPEGNAVSNVSPWVHKRIQDFEGGAPQYTLYEMDGNPLGNVWLMPHLYARGYGTPTNPQHVSNFDKTFFGSERLWNGYILLNGPTLPNPGPSDPIPQGTPGLGRRAVTGVVLFDFTKFRPLDGQGRARYLNENGLFLPINTSTGQLFPRR